MYSHNKNAAGAARFASRLCQSRDYVRSRKWCMIAVTNSREYIGLTQGSQ